MQLFGGDPPLPSSYPSSSSSASSFSVFLFPFSFPASVPWLIDFPSLVSKFFGDMCDVDRCHDPYVRPAVPSVANCCCCCRSHAAPAPPAPAAAPAAAAPAAALLLLPFPAARSLLLQSSWFSATGPALPHVNLLCMLLLLLLS